MKLPKSLLQRARGGATLVAFGGALACADPPPPSIVIEPVVEVEPVAVAVDPVEYDDSAEAARLAGVDGALASNEERRGRRIAAAVPVRTRRPRGLAGLELGDPLGRGWYGVGCGRG